MRLRGIVESWIEHARSRQPNIHSPGRGRRRKLAALVLLLLLTTCSSYFWYFSAEERVRRQAIKAFVSLTGGEVELDHASLRVLEGIRIKGLRIYLPLRPHSDESLVLAADDVILRHRPVSILRRRLDLKQIVAFGAQLHVWYDHDRGLSNLQLLRFGGVGDGGRSRPVLQLRQATLVYREIREGKTTAPVRQRINGEVFSEPRHPFQHKFEIECLAEGALPNAVLTGVYDSQTRRLSTTGEFLLQLIDLTNLPPAVADWQRLHGMSQPSGRIVSRSSYDPETGHSLTLELQDGYLRLPVPGMDLPLTNVVAEITCTTERIIIDQMQGRLTDYGDIHVSGVIEGYGDEAPFAVNVRTEGLDIPSDQWDANGISTSDPNSPLNYLPELAGELIGDFRPTGRMDLDMDFRKEPAGELYYRIVIRANGANITYEGFPYPLDDVRGIVVFDPNDAAIGPLRARRGPAEVNIVGQWARGQGYEISIDANQVPLNEELYGALELQQQEMWHRFSPAGRVNVFYHKQQLSGSGAQDDLNVQLLDATMRYREFPVPLRGLFGQVELHDEGVTFNIERGVLADGSVKLQGEMGDLAAAVPSIDCRAQFADVLLDAELVQSLPAGVRERFAKVQVTGIISGQAHIWTDANDSAVEPTARYTIETTLADGGVVYSDPPYELSEVQGTATVSDAMAEIHSLMGRNGETRLSLQGWMKPNDDYQWHIEGRPFAVSPELVEGLDKNWKALTALNPKGLADIIIDIRRRPEQSEPNYVARIRPLECEIRPSFFPYRFANVTGSLTAHSGGIDIDQVISSQGDAQVKVTGTIDTDGEGSSSLAITTESILLDESLQQALPAGPRAFLERFGITGAVDLDCTFNSVELGEDLGNWRLLGDATLKDSSGSWPFLIENIGGNLAFDARHDQAGNVTQVDGKLTKLEMLVDKRPIEKLTAEVVWLGPQQQARIREINGVFCKGRLAGEIAASFADSEVDYEIELRCDDVDLAELMEAKKEPQDRNDSLRGRFTGWLSVSDKAQEEKRGKFLFIIKEAVLGDLPLAARILHVLNLSFPTEGAFNSASISGNIVGADTQFDEIHLTGPALSLTGAGVMSDPNNNLDLVFVVDPPSYMQNVPVLSSFIKAVRPAVVQVRATGPFENPTVTPVALPTLDEALRGLTGKQDER